MEQPILEFRNVYKSYSSLPVLNNVNFALPQGQIVGLLGPNGSGKTTMLKLINGLIQPDMGEILIAGKKPSIETKKMISYLPDVNYLIDWMKVKDLVAFFADFYEDFDLAKANDMLLRLNVNPDQKLKTLSKGTKEKVQLVLVMARNAWLYLLDEPIGGVDPAARDYILDTILQNYAPNATILISTHLIADVEQIFDGVLFLSQGQIVLQGLVDNIRTEHGKSIDTLFREVFRC